jgi:hypothetical protein
MKKKTVASIDLVAIRIPWFCTKGHDKQVRIFVQVLEYTWRIIAWNLVSIDIST